MRKQITLFWVIGSILFVIIACAPSEPQRTTASPLRGPTTEGAITDPQMVAWGQKKAIPFKTARPGSGFDDLQPLKKIVGDARIVALGEATHGTHEFQEMKARLFEFLVEETGFNTWAMEVAMPESFLVNDYVQTGIGNPERLLSGLHFWIWNTQEVLDMIKWMRAHNEKPGATKVSFYGFDVPYSRLPMDNVIDYLKKVDPQAVEQANSLYRCFLRDLPRPSTDSDVLPFTQACTDNLQRAYDNLANQRVTYERLSSPDEFARALQNARIILQIDGAYNRSNDFSGRDRAMAENVTWLLNHAGPDAKIVLSAHNFHVQTDNAAYRSMGSFLRAKYGREMVVFGTSFYGGSVNVIVLPDNQPSAHPLAPPPGDSYESYLHGLGIPQFFLDLRDLDAASPIATWMLGPHPFRWVNSSALANPDNAYLAHLPSEFDVIIYFDETSPSILLPMR